MNESKSLTLDEAIKAIKHEQWDSQGTYNIGRDRYYQGMADGLDQAKSILARVDQPSEEDMAVLWLTRIQNQEWHWAEQIRGWYRNSDPHAPSYNPTEEARKLGWKP